MRGLLFALSCGALFGQPAISTPALNDASSTPYGIPNGGIAQGSRFYLLGRNLGPTTAVSSREGAVTLGGTSIKVTVAGTAVDALVSYAASNELIGILPADTPVGDGQVAVTFGGQTSRTAPITVVRSAFGLYSLNILGNGPLDALNILAEKETANTILEPAAAGSQISLIGTGLGVNSPGVEVLIGNKTVTPSLVDHRASGYDEILFDLPEGLRGCYVPVALRVDSVISNYGTISVDSGDGSCGDSFGLPSEAIKRVREGGDLGFGAITLNRFRSGDVFDDSVNGTFSVLSQEQVFSSWGPLGAPSPGHCMVIYSQETTLPFDPVQPDPLAAGPIAIRGAKGTVQVNPRSGFYSGLLGDDTDPFLDPGEFAVTNGSGSRDVGGFTTRQTIPAPFQWANQTEVGSKIPRSADLTVKWSGTDPDDDVILYGGGSPSSSGGAIFVCAEKGAVGQITVPAAVLGTLPALATYSSTDDGSFGGAMWLVRSTPLPKSTFQAPGIDVGYFNYQDIIAKAVVFE